jgi:hypothetical protein
MAKERAMIDKLLSMNDFVESMARNDTLWNKSAGANSAAPSPRLMKRVSFCYQFRLVDAD